MGWNRVVVRQLDIEIEKLLLYGEVDMNEINEDIFCQWFIKTHGEFPIALERLPDQEFMGLTTRYLN